MKKIKGPVLVTGATGFIGKRIVRKLLEQGVSVRGLVLPGDMVPAEWGPDVECITGSVTDSSAVKAAMDRAGTVIHCAAMVGDWGDEKIFREVTVEGSRLIFDEAVSAGSRVVLLSSICVYGDRIYRGICSEEAGYGKTFGPYSRTKQAQERLAWEYYTEKGMDLVVVRPANVYGAGSGPWVHDVVTVIQSGVPSLVGKRSNNAGLIHVDNLADLILTAAGHPGSMGKVYNASDELDVTWEQYFTDIAAMVGKSAQRSIPRMLGRVSASACEIIWKAFRIKKRPPLTREALNLIGSDNRFPADRARRELGFVQAVSYEEGLREVKSYLETYSIQQGNIL